MSPRWTLALPLLALVACGDKYDGGEDPDAVDGSGDGAGGDDGGGSGGEDNHPPTAPSVALTPDPADTTDDLVALASGSTDVDGDPVTYTYTWSVDGADSAASTSDTLPAAATSRGETWTVTVLPTDGDLVGAAGTASVTIVNAPPTLGTPAIASSSAGVFVGDTLTCSATVEDDDDDATSVSYAWTNTTSGAALGSLATLLLEYPAVAPGDGVSCEITAEDEVGDQATASTAVTVDNRAPTVDTVAISPESAVTTATTLTCAAIASDADGDTPTLDLAWSSSDGGVAATGDTLVLTPGDVQPGETVTCTATATDAQGETGTDAASVTIDNTAPVLDTVSISPASGALRGDTVTCAVSASDADGETLTEAFEWTDAGGTLLGSSADLVVPTTATPGDVLTCTATVSDAHGGSQSGTATTTVDNEPPTASGVTITPDPATVTDALTCAWTYSDTEGDAEASTVSWTLGGVEVGTGTTLSSGFVSGDTVTCTVTPDDGYDTGTAASASLTISNAAPSVSGVSLDPDPATAADTLTCAWTFSDADGDADASTVAWTVDGSGAGSGTTLSGAFVGGQTVVCAVTPYDGTDAGTVASTSLVVSNTAPTAPEISVSPARPVAGTDDLVCSIDTASTDIDGDTLTVDYSWTADGVAMSAYDGLDTVPASAVTTGGTWTCTVSVTDGTDTVSASASATACTTATYYADGDGDGHGDSSGGTAEFCEGEDTTGYAPSDDDCDDTDAAISPSAYEACDGVDNDCDGTLDPTDEDADGDGWTTCDGDCDDADATVNPGALEICGNDVDEDCDRSTDGTDLDGDGYLGCDGTDCNDYAASVNPGATEVLGDGLDNDCDGVVDDGATDDDGDGETEDDGDCDDAVPWVSTTATEVPDNGVDEDCDGSDATASTWTASDAVFVDADFGSDFFPGSPAYPVKTISQGVSLASAAGLPVVATAESYTEDVSTDVDIFGGYASDWSGVTGQSVLTGSLTYTSATGSPVVSALDVEGVVQVTSGGAVFVDGAVTADGTQAWAMDGTGGSLLVAGSTVKGPSGVTGSDVATIVFGASGGFITDSVVEGGAGSDGEDGLDATTTTRIADWDPAACLCWGSSSCYGTSVGDDGEQGSTFDTATVEVVDGGAISISGSVVLGGIGGAGGDGGIGTAGTCMTTYMYPFCGSGGDGADGTDGGPVILVDARHGEAAVTGSVLTGGVLGRGGAGGDAGDAGSDPTYCWRPRSRCSGGYGGAGGNAGAPSPWFGALGNVALYGTTVGAPTSVRGNEPDIGLEGQDSVGVYNWWCYGDASSEDGADADYPSVTGAEVDASSFSASGTPAFVNNVVLVHTADTPGDIDGVLEAAAVDAHTTGIISSGGEVSGNVVSMGTSAAVDLVGIVAGDGELARNQVYLECDGSSVGLWSTDSVTALSNLVEILGTDDAVGVQLDGEDGALVNTTVVLEGAGVGVWTTSSHMVGLVNNLVQTGTGGTCFVDDTSTRDYMLNNLAWGCTNQLYEDSTGFRTRAAEMDFITVTTSAGGHVHDDPLFTDASGGDYTLDTGSPALDAGYGVSSSTFGAITTDVFGSAAPAGSGYDIGATEQ